MAGEPGDGSRIESGMTERECGVTEGESGTTAFDCQVMACWQSASWRMSP